MKQYFELGLCVASITGILAVLLQDWSIVYRFSGIIGLTAIVFACLVLLAARRVKFFRGTPISPIVARRKQYAAALMMFSLPNLLAFCFYILFH